MDAKLEIASLRETILTHNRNYYELDTPTISDFEYDALMRRLKELEAENEELITKDSPTMTIGGKAQSGFRKVRHEIPLESLVDVFSMDELQSFISRMDASAPETRVEYVVEPKIDGLSVALFYEDGVFMGGATRGDGTLGEDVSDNLKTVRSLPKKLKNAPSKLVVRGEIYMAREVFEEHNRLRELNDEPIFKNPRNLAAGSMRQLDPEVTAERCLDIVVFNIQSAEPNVYSTHEETLIALDEMGFPVVSHLLCREYSEIEAEVSRLSEARGGFPFDIDGAVIKMNSLKLRGQLGSTSKAPRWAVAYKYPPEQKESRVADIIVQVGRTGVLTPKAVLEPVRLAGTTVTNATLHNQDFIDRLDLRVGDAVIVQKAGEIIPEILTVLRDKRPPNTVPCRLPVNCPDCGGATTRDTDGAATRCTNPFCPAQLLRSISHFASRGAMDIEGLGPAVVEALVNADLISSPADLYYLSAESVAALKGFGKKSAEKLIDSIESSKERGLTRLLCAFGIRQVGQKAAKILCSHYKSLDELMAAPEEALQVISDIGPITAGYLTEWFKNPESIRQIERLRAAGLNFNSTEQISDARFLGKTFVLTGTLSGFTREEAEALIEKFGGKTAGSVSKKTSYVLAGDKAGSKLEKAETLGITIISEADFAAMIE